MTISEDSRRHFASMSSQFWRPKRIREAAPENCLSPKFTPVKAWSLSKNRLRGRNKPHHHRLCRSLRSLAAQGAVAQWQRARLQIRSLGVRISLASLCRIYGPLHETTPLILRQLPARSSKRRRARGTKLLRWRLNVGKKKFGLIWANNKTNICHSLSSFVKNFTELLKRSAKKIIRSSFFQSILWEFCGNS